ncbi:hypothetical protein [Ferruginibacter sp.]|nr:hypothetical protein [Ferruginibacter sp.]
MGELTSLNTVFEGKAVGEAFCNRGKTDIYLNIDRGNILIVECKIWKGKSEYISAINQLLSYLTWRNNYGILITFCRINNFLKLIGESFDFVGEISDVRNAMKRINDSHFISYHKLPSDESRNVEIHHVFYNLFTK